MESPTLELGVLDSAVPRNAAIEADYRAGQLTLRQIGAKHGLSESYVRKLAREGQWERDLRQDVTRRSRELLMVPKEQAIQGVSAQAGAQDGAQAGTQAHLCAPMTLDEAMVEVAARAQVQVVREHRAQIGAGQQMVGVLLGQLQDAVGNRDALHGLIEVETKDDENGKRRAVLMKAVSLPAHAGVMKDLAMAMKHLVGLERQAFGIADADDPTPPEPPTEKAQTADPDYSAIREQFAKRLGNSVTDVEPR